MAITTEQLLTSLGWDEQDLENKGMLHWQKSPHPLDENGLPITASLVVTPKKITAKILNVLPRDTMDQHFLAEWDITGDAPVLQKYLYAGEDLTSKMNKEGDNLKVAEGFRGLVLSFQTLGKKDILGKRKKSQEITSDTKTPSVGA